MQFLSQIYSRDVTIDDTVGVHFSEVIEFLLLD